MKKQLLIIQTAFSSCSTHSVQLDRYVELDQKSFNSSSLSLDVQIEKYIVEKKYYQDIKKIFDDAAVKNYFKKLAREKKVSESLVRSQFFQEKVPTDAELKSYFEKNRDKIPYSYEFAKSELKTQMAEDLEKTRSAELITELEVKNFYDLDVDKPAPPKISVDPGSFPTIGNTKNPKVTIVEVFDFLCPFCKMEEPKIQRLLKKFPDKILLVVIDYTLVHGEMSRKLALAGYCAKKMDRYPAFRENFIGFMQNDEVFYKQAPQVLKILQEALKSCMNGFEAKKNVDRAESLIKDWGLSQTPVFFLNGEFSGNELSEQAIEKYILEN